MHALGHAGDLLAAAATLVALTYDVVALDARVDVEEALLARARADGECFLLEAVPQLVAQLVHHQVVRVDRAHVDVPVDLQTSNKQASTFTHTRD